MAQRAPVTAEIVPIGNSKGLRIPKNIREEIGLEGRVTLSVAGGALIVRPTRLPRADWPERFARVSTLETEELLIPDDIANDFDAEWTW